MVRLDNPITWIVCVIYIPINVFKQAQMIAEDLCKINIIMQRSVIKTPDMDLLAREKRISERLEGSSTCFNFCEIKYFIYEAVYKFMFKLYASNFNRDESEPEMNKCNAMLMVYF